MRRLLLALSLLGCSSVANAGDAVLVLVNARTAQFELGRAELADLYLGRRQITVGGQALIPLDTRDEALREQFYQAIAAMSSNRVRAYWARRVFSSQGRPPRGLSAEEAAAAVAREPGTLIYTTAERVPPGARLVLRLGAGEP